MATTIPKLNIDVEQLNKARRKLQSKLDGHNLAKEEREALLTLISAAKKVLYPNRMALDRYQYNIDQIGKLDKNTKPRQFEKFAEQIEEFEQKYCW